jgi:hypothetical protein
MATKKINPFMAMIAKKKEAAKGGSDKAGRAMPMKKGGMAKKPMKKMNMGGKA